MFFLGLIITLAALGYLYRKLHYIRYEQLAHLPRPQTSLLWGHGKVFGEIIQRNPQRHVGEQHWLRPLSA
jgi:hypothetical protein